MEEIAVDSSLLNGHRNPTPPPLPIDQLFESTSNFVVGKFDDGDQFWKEQDRMEEESEQGVGDYEGIVQAENWLFNSLLNDLSDVFKFIAFMYLLIYLISSPRH